MGSLAFDTSSRWLLSAGPHNNYSCVFDTATWTQIGRLNHDATLSIAFVPGQSFVATGGISLTLWRSPTAQEPEFSISTSPTLRGLAFSSDGHWLATSGHLWKFNRPSDDVGLQPPQEIERWRWINGPASAVAFAREGGIFAVAGNNTVQVRQVDDEPNVGVREIVRLPIDGAELSSLSFGPSGNWILTAAETLTQWPLVSGSEHVRLHFDTTVEALAVSPDPAARRLAMTLGDGTLRIWDTSTWRELPKREIQKVDGRETRSSVASVMAFSANASWLAATIDKTLTVFSTADWRELTHSEHADAVGKVGFTSDNRLLIAVSDTHVMSRPPRPGNRCWWRTKHATVRYRSILTER